MRKIFITMHVVIAMAGIASSRGRAAAAFDPFLDTLQHRTFNYFWLLTDPANGLTPDRAPTESFSSVAAVGFALTAYTSASSGATSRGRRRRSACWRR